MAKVSIISSAAATGSRVIPSEEVDRAFGMPVGKLRSRAGIESLAYAAEGENEFVLGARAAEEVLRRGSCGAQALDWIIVTSETHHNYPSLSAELHSRLLVRENCGALPVPQPSVHTPSIRNATVIIVLVLNLFLLFGERDRMPTQKQASGQRS
jgi:3-oxoacyl-[acyl-carrier-protein] synthase III